MMYPMMYPMMYHQGDILCEQLDFFGKKGENMTNDGVVTKLLSGDMAEVAVVRSSACGGNCASCEACAYQNEMKAVAINKVHAQPGQRVIIETSSSVIFGAALLVYIMPMVFFVAGYALAAVLGLGENLRVLISFAALLLSAVVLILSQRIRKKKAISYEIIEICGENV